jgi:hypothetical protein
MGLGIGTAIIGYVLHGKDIRSCDEPSRALFLYFFILEG